jgi:hypothetical protein
VPAPEPSIQLRRPDFFAMLLGRWGFDREIEGHGRMTGVATWVEVGAGRAEYFESGELSMTGGARLRAEQRYAYERMDGGFWVSFAGTGELFQRVVFEEDGRSWRAAASHLCGGDVYESEYCFPGDGTFAVLHAVKGPKKDYVIRTCYRRD